MTAPATKPVPQPTGEERVSLTPERVVELHRRQTGGDPVGINADDPTAIIGLVRDRGKPWLEDLDKQILEAEKVLDDLYALRLQVERMARGAK